MQRDPSVAVEQSLLFYRDMEKTKNAFIWSHCTYPELPHVPECVDSASYGKIRQVLLKQGMKLWCPTCRPNYRLSCFKGTGSQNSHTEILRKFALPFAVKQYSRTHFFSLKLFPIIKTTNFEINKSRVKWAKLDSFYSLPVCSNAWNNMRCMF